MTLDEFKLWFDEELNKLREFASIHVDEVVDVPAIVLHFEKIKAKLDTVECDKATDKHMCMSCSGSGAMVLTGLQGVPHGGLQYATAKATCATCNGRGKA